MKLGSLVRSRHDHGLQGLVIEVGPEETRTDHGSNCVRIVWLDGEQTIEFSRMLEVVSEVG